MGAVVAVRGRRGTLAGGWALARKGAAAGDAGSSEGAGEAEKGSAKGVGDYGRSLKGARGLIGVDLEEVDEKVDTCGDGTVPDDTAGRELHVRCFESGAACLSRTATMG